MNLETEVPDLSHPAWVTFVGTVVGYGVILVLLTVALFGGAWLLFSLL